MFLFMKKFRNRNLQTGLSRKRNRILQIENSLATIVGLEPEKDFLPKTVVGFDFMSEMIESRMKNRIPMNRIALAVSDALGFSITRQ